MFISIPVLILLFLGIQALFHDTAVDIVSALEPAPEGHFWDNCVDSHCPQHGTKAREERWAKPKAAPKAPEAPRPDPFADKVMKVVLTRSVDGAGKRHLLVTAECRICGASRTIPPQSQHDWKKCANGCELPVPAQTPLLTGVSQ